jgi:hypothetical protein
VLSKVLFELLSRQFGVKNIVPVLLLMLLNQAL